MVYGKKLITKILIPWNSTELKLYLITEFERLKTNEAYQYKVEWSATRLLSKVNYVVHTDAIKNA